MRAPFLYRHIEAEELTMEHEQEPQAGAMRPSKRRHTFVMEVGDSKLRMVMKRGTTMQDAKKEVQRRLSKKRKTDADPYLVVTEIRERPKTASAGKAGGRGGSSAPDLLAETLELDSDDALSDLIDSDGETTFVAMLDEETGGASAADASASAGGGGGGAPGPPSVATSASAAVAATHADSANSDKGRSKGQGKRKAQVPHDIPFTVAGMPRSSAGAGGGDSDASRDKRGPREGTVTVFADSSLRDLKRAIAQTQGVHFTPDNARSVTAPPVWIKAKVTVAPNITVPINVDPGQTVRDLWRMVAAAVAAAAAAAAAAQPGGSSNSSGHASSSDEVVAAAAAAAEAAAAATPSSSPGGGDCGNEDGEEDGGTGVGGDSAASTGDFALPDGQVLMRQQKRAALAAAAGSAQSLLLSGDGAEGFLWFPDDVLGGGGCRLEDGEELILVGPGAVSADDIPSWMVRVLVLGQPVGCISIPNRRLAEETVTGWQTTSHAPAAGDEQQQQRQLRTLGDLRSRLCKELQLPSDRVDIWIASPPKNDCGGSGTGAEPMEPAGEKASFDDMTLGHYGLVHGGAIDVRIRPLPQEQADAVADAAAAVASVDPFAASAAAGGDVVRLTLKTNAMVLRGEEGVGLFVSRSTFGLALLKRLASRALKMSLSRVARISFDKRKPRFSGCYQRWLRECGDEICSGAGLVVHATVPSAKSRQRAYGSRPPPDSDDEDGSSESSVRMTVALWVEEESRGGQDPLGVSSAPASATLYPLRSTGESDGVGLREWGLLREGVRVYAVFYATRSRLSAPELADTGYLSGRGSVFGTSLCWHSRPVPSAASSSKSSGSNGPAGDRRMNEEDDSAAGKACFLSCAYMVCERVRELQQIGRGGQSTRRVHGGGDDDGDGDTVGWLLRELMALLSPRFPPAALALHQLGAAEDVTDAECACLVQCLWGLAREMVPGEVPDKRVLESSRTFLSWLVSRASASRANAQRERSRELAIIKKKQPELAAEAACGASSKALEAGGAAVESVSLQCWRLVERLEPGHAARLRVDGELLDGVYSTGGARQKRQELLEADEEEAAGRAPGGRGGRDGGADGTAPGGPRGNGSAGEGAASDGGGMGCPRTIEVVSWEAAGRLLLACPFATKLPVLRFAHPKGRKSARGDRSSAPGESAETETAAAPGEGADDGEGKDEDPASWLSLVDWPACVRRTGAQAFLRVVAPLSLSSGPCPSLTRDREGHLCVFTGKAKDLNKSLYLFTPLKGGSTITEDPQVLAQCLDVLRRSSGGLPGGDEFEEAVSAARVAREVVVVCMDSSYSMGGPPGFEGDVDSDEEREKERRARSSAKLEWDWSDPPPYATGAGKGGDGDGDSMEVDGSDEEEEEEEDDDDDADDDADDTSTGQSESDTGSEDTADRRARKGGEGDTRADELRRKRRLLADLLAHPCLPQLQDAASLINKRYGEWKPLTPWRSYPEAVIEELVLENFNQNKASNWARANREIKVYRRFRKEFMDVLLKRGQFKDRDSSKDQDQLDVSEWAPRQFLCPITQALVMDPVVAADGHSYERHAILEWFEACRRDSREPTSPMTGQSMTSEDVMSNHALKSRIQDWVVESNRADDAADKETSSSPATRIVEVNFKYRSKALKIKVDQNGGSDELARLKNLVSRWKAGVFMAPVAPGGGGPDAGGFSVGTGGSGGGGGGDDGSGGRRGGGRRRGGGSRRRRGGAGNGGAGGGGSGSGAGGSASGGGSSTSSSAAGSSSSAGAAPSATVCPSSIRLLHGGHALRALWSLRENDMVVAVDVEGSPSSTFTVKIEDCAHEDVFLLSRRDETVFSLKLRLWARHLERRPSEVELWYGLKDVGDGVRSGLRFHNCTLPADSHAPTPRYGAEPETPPGLCVLEVFRRNPYKRRYKDSRPTLTRLDAVKQLFHAYINRVQAYDLAQEVGLISFGSEVSVNCHPTALLENFRDEVDALCHSGDTSLWDALSQACTLLEKWMKNWRESAKARLAERKKKRKSSGGGPAPLPKEEDPVLRIMVLSDGDDTKSSTAAHNVCGRLQKVGVIVDSITVGTEKNLRLKCLSLATGGYAFHPTTLRAALRLNEQETVLSAGQRARQRPVSDRTKRVSSEALLLSSERVAAAHDTEETATIKEDPMIKSTCKPLAAALATLGPADKAGGGDGGGAASSGRGGGGGDGGEAGHPERQRRVQREMKNLMEGPHESFEVFPSDENMHFWKMVLSGPASTPYGGGCWMLSMFFPSGYPSVAPKVRFVTPIRHCNINSHGRVCHAIFDRSWTPNTSVADILSCVYGLLLFPDHDDPLDSTLALQMYDSNGAYEAAIIEHVKAHASKPKRVWVTEIEAAGLSSQERLTMGREAVQQAKDHRSAGRLDEAKTAAEIAAVFAAGGAAPITGAPARLPRGAAHRAQFQGLDEVRAAAHMVYAWALLDGDGSPKLEVGEAIAQSARVYDSNSPDVTAYLAEIASRKWKLCDAQSRIGIKRLKEAIRQQTLHVGMLDIGSAAKKEAKKALNVLTKELRKVAPRETEDVPSYHPDDNFW